MRDTFTHTERDAARFEDAHADRELPWDYEPEPPTEPPTEPRSLPADDPIALTVRAAYIDAGLMFPCECGDSFWSRQALEVHRERRHG